MRRFAPTCLIALVIGDISMLSAAEDKPDDQARRSVVRISSSICHPDPFRPWSRSSPSDATGTGVILAGNRILTNAHVVNFASQILVQFDRSGEKHAARAIAVAPGIDLALLELTDPAPLKGHPPLAIHTKPLSPQQAIVVYGYPEGGSDLSVTRGIVSRIEFSQYYLGVEGLRVQVDAAINPGNSGGPAVLDGQLAGLVFSKLSQSDNIGYIIPVEEISLFLKDVEDGRYDGKPYLPIAIQDLENPSLRASLKLDGKVTGILVRQLYRPESELPLRVDDVITKIGGIEIDNTGMVRLDADRRLQYRYLVQASVRGGKLPVTVIRDGRTMELSVPVDSDQRWLVRRYYEGAPPYFIFGPIVFAEATEMYAASMIAYGKSGEEEKQGRGESERVLRLAGGIPLYSRNADRATLPDEHMVHVPSPMFSHKIAKGYDDPYGHVVAEVDGIKVRNLRHLVEILRDAKGEFVTFTFQGHMTNKITFRRKEIIAATEEVLDDNGIRQQSSPDLLKVWDLSKAR